MDVTKAIPDISISILSGPREISEDEKGEANLQKEKKKSLISTSKEKKDLEKFFKE